MGFGPLTSNSPGDLLMAEDGWRAGPSEELTKAFNELSDAVYMSDEQVRAIDRQAIDDLFRG